MCESRRTWKRAERRGTTAIEYGLIAALVSVFTLSAIQAMGASVSKVFSAIKTALGFG